MDQISTVRRVSADVVAEEDAVAPPEILVINKIDRADPLVLAALRGEFPDAVFVSAVSGERLDDLFARVRDGRAPEADKTRDHRATTSRPTTTGVTP